MLAHLVLVGARFTEQFIAAVIAGQHVVMNAAMHFVVLVAAVEDAVAIGDSYAVALLTARRLQDVFGIAQERISLLDQDNHGRRHAFVRL
jgi:hypothetical protein